MRETNQFVRSVDSKTKETAFGGERVNRVSGRQLSPPNTNINVPKQNPKPAPNTNLNRPQAISKPSPRSTAPIPQPAMKPSPAPRAAVPQPIPKPAPTAKALAPVAEAVAPNAKALAPQEPKQPVRGPVQIVSRDLEIIEFILDMKFASLDEVFEKFFAVTGKGEPAKSSEWARNRLQRLVNYNYLKPIDQSVPVRHFIVTKFGYETLMNYRNLDKVPKNPPNIDVRIFTHDKMVLRSRLEFEKAHPQGKWISDRRLRSGMAAMFNLPSAYIPDGIYETSWGERIAFELENATKGRGAYREKITYFAKLIESKKDDPNMFTKVRFRCVREDAFKIIREECAVYPELFQVELWENGRALLLGGE